MEIAENYGNQDLPYVIVFEGVDLVGKTTLIKKTIEAISKANPVFNGYEIVELDLPNQSNPLLRELKEKHYLGTKPPLMSVESSLPDYQRSYELSLHGLIASIYANATALYDVIRGLKDPAKTIIFVDRYIQSSLVYDSLSLTPQHLREYGENLLVKHQDTRQVLDVLSLLYHAHPLLVVPSLLIHLKANLETREKNLLRRHPKQTSNDYMRDLSDVYTGESLLPRYSDIFKFYTNYVQNNELDSYSGFNFLELDSSKGLTEVTEEVCSSLEKIIFQEYQEEDED